MRDGLCGPQEPEIPTILEEMATADTKPGETCPQTAQARAVLNKGCLEERAPCPPPAVCVPKCTARQSSGSCVLVRWAMIFTAQVRDQYTSAKKLKGNTLGCMSEFLLYLLQFDSGGGNVAVASRC